MLCCSCCVVLCWIIVLLCVYDVVFVCCCVQWWRRLGERNQHPEEVPVSSANPTFGVSVVAHLSKSSSHKQAPQHRQLLWVLHKGQEHVGEWDVDIL